MNCEIIEVLERALNYLDLAAEDSSFEGLIWGTGDPVDWDLISGDVREALYKYHATKGIARVANQNLIEDLRVGAVETQRLRDEVQKVNDDVGRLTLRLERRKIARTKEVKALRDKVQRLEDRVENDKRRQSVCLVSYAKEVQRLEDDKKLLQAANDKHENTISVLRGRINGAYRSLGSSN